ncbi:MAG TPA: hypothetical protein VJ910_14745 [Desulfuromonadales bacterium]|nr:hypothetical protein [Desulfuromonadales bacterium]
MNRPNTPLPDAGSISSHGQLGTFLGVYTPTVLTILGVIMYLRFGWVIGQVGVWQTLLIVVLAHAITLATAMSLAAIATNTHVGIGGAYYMISRSLGLEFGGAIGLPLFLSQVLSVTLYAYGLAESLQFVWADLPVAPTAFIIILLVGALSLRGAAFALKAQLPILVLIGASLVMLALGAWFGPGSSAGLEADLPSSVQLGFWPVFAVFFPAVTGIMAGLSLSGDLAEPRRAIPRGAMLATLTGLCVYLTVPIFLTMGSDRMALLEDPLVWTRIALFGAWLVLPGLWGAVFSSAVGSMLGAPRTLQALALDRLAPRKLRGSGEAGAEPKAGLLLTIGLSLGAVLLGDLNTVATVVTMFFLTVYATLNLAAALGQLSGNLSWRPTARAHWSISLFGALGCLGAMVLIHWPATLFAVVVEILLWIWFKNRVGSRARGDLRRDLYEALIRWSLLRLADRPLAARNWRPHIIIFVTDVAKRLDLVRFGAWFAEKRGVVSVCEMVEGDILDLELDARARQDRINRILRDENIIAFGEVSTVKTVEGGLLAITQAHGMAGIECNVALVGWPDDRDRLVEFLKVIRRLKCFQRSLIIGKVDPVTPFREGARLDIDIWWGGLQRNGDLMLLLAYLLSRNPEWRGARIRILSVASNQLMKEQTEGFLHRLIPEIRIEAEVSVRVKQKHEVIPEIMMQESAEADVVLLGLATPEAGKEQEYVERLETLAAGLPTCFFVHNGSLFVGDLATPEELTIEDDEEGAENAEDAEKAGEAGAKDANGGRDETGV